MQFTPLDSLRVVHFGHFWDLIRHEFAAVEEQAALDPQFEALDDQPVLGPATMWRMMDRPELPRVWFLGPKLPAGQQLLQLQQDRLIANWRRDNVETQEYPRYDALRALFAKHLKLLERFVRDEKLGEIQANQCEVTYVNRISVPEDSSFGEFLSKCFPLIGNSSSDGFLPQSPERATLQMSYRMDRNLGRLYVSAQPGVLRGSGSVFIDFRLTARGAPLVTHADAVMEWLDVGHHWVVNGFKSFTSDRMHRAWGLVES